MESLIPSSFFSPIKFCSLFSLSLSFSVSFFPCRFQKYLHVPFIEIWRQRAVAGCVVDCWGCWWYGAAALVLCGRWYYGGRCGRLVPWTGRWRRLRCWIGGFVDLHVFSEGAGMCVWLVAHFAQIGLVRRVDVHVFLAVTAVCKSPVAAFEFTLKRLLTGVSPFVNF